ncbi:M23 family metallopeptidase [Cryobacterium suzukii]|uniref:M23 family metallopeptidase n=1 Tax=Cryobacterium suzukii TaxID=1259198 RepID=A0A4R9AE41_9MICO|nr:M23 family metallopeptidase [Cryobacterium suzukii]TFD59071.1 M23 family metallopeptidase [Cryobacterium suzukii]
MDSTGHVATAPHISGAIPQMSRRDVRAMENLVRAGRSGSPRTAPPVKVPLRPIPLRQRAAAASAMAMIALLAIGTSLPALAVNPEPPQASAASAEKTADLQSVTAAGTTSVPIERDGYTITEAPEPASYTEVATNGEYASLSPGQLSDQGWALPVLGRISSPFGSRPNKPVDGVGDFHNGTDIAAPCGQPVFAATGGKVVTSGAQGSYGNWVLIDHGDGIETGYAHNSQLLVDSGQLVVAGEIIALVGSTGASSGCHVHFETRVDGEGTNAESFMSSRGVTLG